jgi:hypothetical protein
MREIDLSHPMLQFAGHLTGDTFSVTKPVGEPGYLARYIFLGFLHNRAIHPNAWYLPVVQAALGDWPIDQRLYVALDTTALTPFVLIRASLVYRGRAISVAWRALRHRSTQVGFEARPSRA